MMLGVRSHLRIYSACEPAYRRIINIYVISYSLKGSFFVCVSGPGTTMDGIGISGTAVNTTVTLPATVTFNITDDDVSLEVNETYSLTVTTSDSSEIFEERTTTIIITDDVDGKYLATYVIWKLYYMDLCI